MTAPKLDDCTPFPWGEIRPRAKAIAPRAPKADPIEPAEMQAVAIALFGECKICKALLDVDGTCPAMSEHPKHECPDCGAEHDEPLSVARPCLFEAEHGGRMR